MTDTDEGSTVAGRGLTQFNIYTIRRKHLLANLRFLRANGRAKPVLRQDRMELAALRSCRALVS